MILYWYTCPEGHAFCAQRRADELVCPDHGQLGKRQWGFSHHRGVSEHWNHSLGRWVSNKGDFEDGLKQQSESMTERMGFDVNYTRVDPRDKDTLGVTDEGIERPTGRKVYSL